MAAGFQASPADAADVPARGRGIAILDAKVVTLGPRGTIDRASVFVRNGRIEKIVDSGDVEVPRGYLRIEAAGRTLTPGIFAAFSRLGAIEISLARQSNDDNVEKGPFHAAFDIAWGINPRASAIPINRIAGITRAAVSPVQGDGVFAGFGALIHLGIAKDVVFKRRAFAVAYLGDAGARAAGGARGGAVVYLLTALHDAARLAKARDKDAWRGIIPRVDAEALAPVLAGDVPLVVHVSRASDITQLVALKRELPDLDLVIAGGEEAWMVAGDLAAVKIPVILHPFANLPGSFSTLAATQMNAGRLERAGVLFAIADTQADAHNPRLIPQYAGNAVANGLSREGALRAIILNPARIFGVDDRLGSIEPGKTADLVVWSGDPLEVTTRADAVVIGGQLMPMVSRQTELRDRYRDLKVE
ncbi:MAG: amidohydrolase, partial [Alphaproteobacteria bacterium]